MRCHTSCCSWKTRPPFSNPAPLLCAPSIIHHSFALPSFSLCWLPFVSLSFTWCPRHSLHSLCMGQAPWVSHHGNPFTLIMSCELQPLFFTSFFSTPLWQEKVLNYSSKHSLLKKDCRGETQKQKLRGCWWFCFPLCSSSPPVYSSSSSFLLPLFSSCPRSGFSKGSCVVSSHWSPAEKQL